MPSSRRLRNDPGLPSSSNAAVAGSSSRTAHAVGVDYRDAGRPAADTADADREVVLAAGALVTPQAPDAVRASARPTSFATHGIALPCRSARRRREPDRPSRSADRSPSPTAATATFRQGVGWRMLQNGLHFKLFGSGPDHSRPGVEAGAFVNPDRSGRRADHPGLLRADRLSRPRHAQALSRTPTA